MSAVGLPDGKLSIVIATSATLVADRPNAVDRDLSREDTCLAMIERVQTIRKGWNDAAWGRPYRALPERGARVYDIGYAGGLDFRNKSTL